MSEICFTLLQEKKKWEQRGVMKYEWENPKKCWSWVGTWQFIKLFYFAYVHNQGTKERNPCFKISKSLSKLSSLLRLPHQLSVVRLKLRFLLLFSKKVPVQSSCDYFLRLLMCLKVNINERIISKILLGILNTLFSWNPRYLYSFYFIEYRRLNIKIGKDC